MTGQRWRKALWHLRHGGLDGFKQYRQKSRAFGQTAVEPVTSPNGSIMRTADGPELSVIIPAYNASEFIERCLHTVLGQTEVDFEVIVVDDGSTDDTSVKACKLAEHDGRITVLRAENSGPAEARNLGVRRARGTFIAFVDADDEVLPDAYNKMVGSLIRTGSDIATGSYIRLGAGGRVRPKVTARVHARQRLAVRLDDMPELLDEPVLWNKIYRRDFWSRHIGVMTSYSNYEDQVPVYQALTSAAAVDVLTADVYAWRLADGRDTRSRRKQRLTDLRARLSVIEALEKTLEFASEPVRNRAYAIWMGRDLAMHAEHLDTSTKNFRKTLTAAASELKKRISREAWELIPAQDRLYMWVVAAGRLDDIEEILGTRAEETSAVPLQFADGRWTVEPTYVPRLETSIPGRLLRAQPADFVPQTIIRNARWVDDHVIELQGCAYIPGIDPVDVEVHIHGVMDGAIAFDVETDRVNDNRIDLEVGDPWRSYSAGGFRARIDIGEIRDISPRGIDLHGRFETHGKQLLTPAKSTAVVGMIAPSPVVDGERVTIVADEHDELSIRPVAMPATPIFAKQVTTRGRDVAVALAEDIAVDGISLCSSETVIEADAHGQSTFVASLPPLPERYEAGGDRTWTVWARTAAAQSVPVYHESIDYLLPETPVVRNSPNVEGIARLDQRFRRVSITGASNDRDRLLITGRTDPPEKLSIVLKSSDQTIAPVETARHADGSFTAVYDLTTMGPEGGTVASMAGGYYVRYGATPDFAEGWARVADKLAIRPVDCYTEWNTLRLEGRYSGAVAITASPPWSAQERTKHGRFALRERGWGPVGNGILFESYNGKTTNDNPRAIFDDIRTRRDDIPLYWSIRDRRVEVPPRGIPVVEGTAAWHRAIATSRVWVNNNNFPYYVRKRPEQFYLQTWHGTPIKKLLWDLPRRKVPLTYRRLMKTEVPQWDLLLAQSDQAADNLRTGLKFEGAINVGEYPRNERLLKSLSELSAIRQRMHLGADAKVILYVPTWRNSQRNGSSLKWGERLDLETFPGETGTHLLVRSHHMTKSDRVNRPGVIDVTKEPHVEDLMAIADILITDYSSIACDFTITGRRIIHYVPDLESYVKERGFYNNWYKRGFGSDEALVKNEVDLRRKIETHNWEIGLGAVLGQSWNSSRMLGSMLIEYIDRGVRQ